MEGTGTGKVLQTRKPSESSVCLVGKFHGSQVPPKRKFLLSPKQEASESRLIKGYLMAGNSPKGPRSVSNKQSCKR